MARYSLEAIPLKIKEINPWIRDEFIQGKKLCQDMEKQSTIISFSKKDDKTDKMKLVTKLDLEDIDLFTLEYDHSGKLLQALMDAHCIDSTMYKLVISYQSNNEKRYLDIVTNDTLLYKCAVYCHNEKEKRKNEGSIKIDLNVTGFEQYAGKWLYFLRNPNMLKAMIENSDMKIPCEIKNELVSYQRIMRNNFTTLTEEQDKRDIEKNIKRTMRNYKNLRGMKLWEKAYMNGELLPSKPYVKKANNFPHNNAEYTPLTRPSFPDSYDPDEIAFYSPEELLKATGGDPYAEYRADLYYK